jgi:alpha-beta hydrolase superfamily lysophospholipase
MDQFMSIDIAIKYFTNDEGLRFFSQRWIPSDPKALIILVHNVGDHSGRYHHVINNFAQGGYGVATFDHRGHGLSDGRRGDVDRFERWIEDIHSFVNEARQEIPEDTPVVIMAMGVGGLMALNYAICHPDDFDGLVAISPAISMKIEAPRWKRWLGQRLVNLVPRMAVEIGLEPYMLTRDESLMEAYSNDPLVYRDISLRMGREIFNASSMVMPLAFRIRRPILMMQAKDDMVCSSEATQTFFDRIVEHRKKLIMYDGAFHDPLNDVVRDNACNDIRTWLDEVMMKEVS